MLHEPLGDDLRDCVATSSGAAGVRLAGSDMPARYPQRTNKIRTQPPENAPDRARQQRDVADLFGKEPANIMRDIRGSIGYSRPCARRYGLETYRYHRQRYNTLMLRVPRGFSESVSWPEFLQLHEALRAYLNEVTLRVIREEIHSETSEAKEVYDALLPRK